MIYPSRTTPSNADQPSSDLYLPDARVLTVTEVTYLAALYWPPVEYLHAVMVAQCESGLNTGAWNRAAEDSRGLWQISLQYHPQYASFNLGDPQINAYFAAEIWRASGWKAWSCAYKLGLVS